MDKLYIVSGLFSDGAVFHARVEERDYADFQQNLFLSKSDGASLMPDSITVEETVMPFVVVQ